MLGGVFRFLFSIVYERTRSKYPPRCQHLVKDISPVNAAILAVYSDIGPQYI
jgi:hypothetical protein